jgi:hypothetical protein
MDHACHDTPRRCAVCGGGRWWHSRTGARVCQCCYPDALAALQVLADQLNVAMSRGPPMRDLPVEEAAD